MISRKRIECLLVDCEASDWGLYLCVEQRRSKIDRPLEYARHFPIPGGSTQMRPVFAAALVLAASLLMAPGASAQTGPPAVGTEVTFLDDQGVAHGTMTVQGVADPFTDFDPSAPPPDGSRFVMLTVSFDANTPDQAFDTSPYNLRLRDTDGNMVNPSTVYRPQPVTVPDLQPQTLAPGNKVSGVIGFVVPEDAQIDDILYLPHSYRFITLADLMPGAGPLPGVPINWTADGATATITTNITDPFTERAEGYPPAEGMRDVVLFVVFENTGQLPFRADPSNFYLRDVNGNLLGRGSVARPPESPLADLEYQPMSPGDRISGVIPYNIPVDTQLIEVDYWPESARIATVVDLVAAGGVPTASAGPASPAPEGSAPASTAP
jgi:hypothetical protein